jgi:transcriptional regulator with XRE-family HTH domain
MGDGISTKVHGVNTQKSWARINQSCYPAGMVRGDRIDSLLNSLGWSQGELARRVQVSPQTIWKLVNGNSQGSKYLHQIARELGASVEYLTGESDDVTILGKLLDRLPPFRDVEPEQHDMTGIAWIKEVDLELGLGGSYLEVPVEERRLPFPADWLRHYSKTNRENLVFIRGKGTSMEPTIRDGDMCMLDMSRMRVDEQDELWACAFGELGMIKRLRAMPDGTVKIMSDNDKVRDELATDGELHIIARCVGVFRKT